MALSKEKRAAAMKLAKDFIKKHKAEESNKIRIGFMSDDESLGVIKKLPTGLIGFDTLTDGGWAAGHINLIFGGADCGKTSLFFSSIAHQQDTIDDFLAAYLPAEKSLDRNYAEFRGVHLDELLIMEGETAENNTDFCIDCADPEKGVNELIIDTLQALSSKSELYTSKDSARSVEDNNVALK